MESMPFGKHRGKPLSEIPYSYLCWLRRKPDLRDPLWSAVIREVNRRDAERYTTPGPPLLPYIPASLRETAREICVAGYRTLALKSHPDHNGNHDDMVKLNRAIEILRRILGEA